jgi:tetratricopeptide (TPR) repeat protein
VRRKVLVSLLDFLCLAVFSSLLVHAQDTWTWPEKPQNLKVLPKDWPGSRLRPVMVGFTRALGVRCSYCHKGEEGKPLSTYDFASDDNPNKNRARAMLHMLNDIEDDLKKIEPSGDLRVNMWCHTCHHGLPRPMTLDEELGEQYRKKGLQAALDDYAELKKKYYGRAAFDFGEGSLNVFAYSLLENNDIPGAIQVLKLNADMFSYSANVWDSLAEGYMKAGDVRKAQENYEKAVKLDPANQNAKEALQKIKDAQLNRKQK